MTERAHHEEIDRTPDTCHASASQRKTDFYALLNPMNGMADWVLRMEDLIFTHGSWLDFQYWKRIKIPTPSTINTWSSLYLALLLLELHLH